MVFALSFLLYIRSRYQFLVQEEQNFVSKMSKYRCRFHFDALTFWFYIILCYNVLAQNLITLVQWCHFLTDIATTTLALTNLHCWFLVQSDNNQPLETHPKMENTSPPFLCFFNLLSRSLLNGRLQILKLFLKYLVTSKPNTIHLMANYN